IESESEFVNYQKIQIQEPLEKLHGSEQATYLDVHVSDDLVNRLAPGDKTKFVGILRLYPGQARKTLFGRYLEAIHLEETEKEFEEVEILPEEEAEIKRLAKDPKIYEKLVASIAPSIYGHEKVKEAIVLQLFGGVRKFLPNNPPIRGNIHILLVGDPGTGKSQILQATNDIAPKSIYFAGKTSSAVGLTASAVKDEFGEGGWTLKAGALVLSNGGICMADEIDKMDDNDRSALHEAMEQGMVSVAKAGIVTRFKADTSILAAANPKFGRFDEYRNVIEQIDLPPTLISRFDLFFVIKDVLDETKDMQIAKHVLKTHKAGELLYQSKKKGAKIKKSEEKEIEAIATPPIPPELLRKYISYARQNIFPVLTDEAMEEISKFYVNLRKQGKQTEEERMSYPATHRQLEALIRLAEASARVRLSDKVTKEDAERAIALMTESLGLLRDPETGAINIDYLTLGQAYSKTERMREILNIIRMKATEMDRVPIEDIVEEMKTKKVSEEETLSLLRELERKGEIYKPDHYTVAPVDRRA
ncbi:MAG: minichromosome maintenance protein MCM, partial [Candidatus Diapherotrites archaeon]|nr:minichromosome maintenance protein MCM [Candidatus Diapherotrites archaeon]